MFPNTLFVFTRCGNAQTGGNGRNPKHHKTDRDSKRICFRESIETKQGNLRQNGGKLSQVHIFL